MIPPTSSLIKQSDLCLEQQTGTIYISQVTQESLSPCLPLQMVNTDIPLLSDLCLLLLLLLPLAKPPTSYDETLAMSHV